MCALNTDRDADDEAGWHAGSQVQGLDIDAHRRGHHLMLRSWAMEGEVRPDAGAITYALTPTARSMQGVYSAATLGMGTAHRVVVIFQFDTAAATMEAGAAWPLTGLTLGDFDRRILACSSSEMMMFRRTKVARRGGTVYVYAVKRRHAAFGAQDKLAAVIEQAGMDDVDVAWSTNLLDAARKVVVAAAVRAVGKVAEVVVEAAMDVLTS